MNPAPFSHYSDTLPSESVLDFYHDPTHHLDHVSPAVGAENGCGQKHQRDSGIQGNHKDVQKVMQIFQNRFLHPLNKTSQSCLHKESIFFVICQKKQRYQSF